MKTITGTWWVIPALLVLAAEGDVPVKELSDIQNEAVRLVMEKFHKRDNIANAFKLSSVLKAVQTEQDDQTFVSLEIIVKQTNCPKELRKKLWKKPDCKVKRNGKTHNCIGCFEFGSGGHKVLSKGIHCVRQKFVNTTRTKNNRSKTCKKEKTTEPEIASPGAYSFLKSGSRLQG